MSAPVIPGILTITVLDTATIFEGPDTVYRYDLPGTGIIDGWALQAVVDQARELCSRHWPEAEIIVDADGPTTDILTRTFLNKGVAAYPTEALRETEIPVVEEGGEIEITRPTEAAGRGRHRRNGGVSFHPFQLVIGAVVLGIVGMSWWLMGATNSDSTLHPAQVAVDQAENTVAEEVEPSVAEEVPRDHAPEPPRAVLEQDGLRVTMPSGFHLENLDDGLLAIGQDPSLRIHLAADPVHSVPAEAVVAQVKATIDADATLHPLDPEQREQGHKMLRYREVPGDGSEVTWSTWMEFEHQLSVGCHFEKEATVPQEAACRMAIDSLHLTG